MRLHLKIIEADNIPAMDLNGKADPYLIVSLDESIDSDKTNVDSKTLSPKWNKEMHLRIQSLSENVCFVLKDHDKCSKDDPIGHLKRIVKDFLLGIVKEEWMTLIPDNDENRSSRIHLISHLALEGMQPFVDCPFQFLKAGIKIISAKDIPKMDLITDTDPYVTINLQSQPKNVRKTKVAKNDEEPVWNEEFMLELLNLSHDVLTIKLMDKDVLKDDLISTFDIPLGQFPLFEICQREYFMNPAKKSKQGGQIKMAIQIVPLDQPLWETGGQIPVMIPQTAEEFQMMIDQQLP